MVRIALVVVLLAGCTKSGTPTPDLSTPMGAARCQNESIKTKNARLWFSCMHPHLVGAMTFEQYDQVVVSKIGFWEKMAKNNVALEKATDADFTLAPSPDSRYADQVATFPFENDKFEVWRKDGRWYIVDNGL